MSIWGHMLRGWWTSSWRWLVFCWYWLLGAGGSIVDIWKHLDVGQKVEIVIAVVVGFLTIVFQILPWIDSRRAGARVLRSRVVNRVDIVERIEIKEIEAVSLRPHLFGKLE